MNKYLNNNWFSLIAVFVLLNFAELSASGSLNKTNIPFYKSKIDCYELSQNPADLYSDSLSLIFNIPSVSFTGLNNNFSIEDINYYFGNEKSKYLKAEDKQIILERFEDDGKFSADLNFSLFSIYVNFGINSGAVKFGVQDNISGFMNFPKDLFDLFLNGNQPGRTYSFDNFDTKSSWLRYYSLSYALPLIHNTDEFSSSSIKRLQLGCSIKYVEGIIYHSVEKVNSNFYTSHSDNSLKGTFDAEIITAFSDDFDFKYDYEDTKRKNNIGIMPAPAGTGFGFDFGASIELKNKIILSAAINNIGSITWNKNTAKHTLIGDMFINDIFDREQLDSLIEFLESESKPISEFSTPLPSYLLLSAAYDISNLLSGAEAFLIYANYFQGLNSQPGNSLNPIFELQNLISFSDWLPFISYGFRYDETSSFRFPFMLGYSTPVLSLNVSTFDLLSLFHQANQSPNYSFAFSMQFKIL